MKNNIKALQLVEKGLSVKTVSKLTESQINTLHSKLITEQVTPYNQPQKQTFKVGAGGGDLPGSNTGYTIKKPKPGTPNVGASDMLAVQKEEELDEDMEVDVNNDPDATKDGMGIFEKEIGESKKKKSKKKNPWAICTAQLGKEFKTTERSEWSAKQTDKYERCVKDVKKSLKEGKEPLSLFLENEIMRIVEKNLPPKITKGDLVKYLSEQSPAVAPTKPGTKEPTTKPGTKPKPKHPGHNPNPGENPKPKAKKSEMDEQSPSVAPTKPVTKPTTKPGIKPKPKHPGHNPNPGENPKPKAISPEQAKDEVIDAIMKLLQK